MECRKLVLQALVASLGLTAIGHGQVSIAGNSIRSHFSRRRLVIQWNYPQGGLEPLDAAAALREMHKADPRPLLIVRDSNEFENSDEALFGGQKDSELLILLTYWFKCIKVDRRVVTNTSHPFHALFAGEHPPYLLLVSGDDKTRIALGARLAQSKVTANLVGLLNAEYTKDTLAVAKTWLRLLGEYDRLEQAAGVLNDGLIRQIRKKSRAGISRARAKLRALETHRQRLLAREKRLVDLRLRRAPHKKTVADFDEEAAQMVRADKGRSLLEAVRKKKAKKPGPDKTGKGDGHRK